MSKFKSFASQGSFRDYQLQAPDETAKIKEETARTLRGKERAQSFLEENNRIYLQAQKLVQGLEAENRETNFRLETENRQAFKDQLNEEYRLKVQANQAQAAAQQKTLKDISSFSQTAFELYNIIDQKVTENQTKANAARAYAAGADFRTVAAIQSLSDGLTKAEFAQQDFIRKKIAEGANLDAYFALYEARNTRGFIDNIAVAQNTGYAFQGAAQAHLADFTKQNPSATVAQKKVAFQTFRDEYAASYTDANGRALNPELLNTAVYPIMRRIETQVLSEFDRDLTKEREQQIVVDNTKALNVAFENKGAAGVIEWVRTDPSADKFKLLARWVNNRSIDLSAAGLTDEDIYAILDYKFEGVNFAQTGKLTTLRESRAGLEDVSSMLESAKNYRRAKIGETQLIETETKNKIETQIKQQFDVFVIDGDGHLSPQELAQLEAIEKTGPLGFESNALKEARKFTANARVAAELDRRWTAKSDQLNLTVEEVTSVKGNYKLLQKWLPIAEAQEKLRNGPTYKSDKAAIEAAVSQDPRLKAAPVTGDKNYSVRLMQDKYVQMYKDTYARTQDADQARGITLNAIQTMLANPKSITQDGKYAEIVAQEKKFAAEGKNTLENYKGLLDVLSKPEIRKDPQLLATTIGAATVYNAYDDMMAGKEPPAIIKQGAAIMRVSPLEFMNYLAVGAGQPAITYNTQVEQIQRSLKPITQRLYNGPYRTNERTERANYSNPSISRGNFPVRSSLTGIAPTGTNTGYQITDPRDGDSGVDFVIQNGQRGAPYYFPLSGKVLKVVNNMNEEYRLEEGDTRRSFGNLVEVQVKIPQLNNRVVDVLIAHFDKVNDLKPGDIIPSNTLLGTQGRTGSTTGAHISFDCYVPGTNMPDSVCRDWFRNNHIK